jgi:hypothetical protein
VTDRCCGDLDVVGWREGVSEGFFFPGPVAIARPDRLQNPGLGNYMPSSWIPPPP